MNYLMTVLTALASIVALFIVTKLLGNRQISQLSLFDYVTGITLGSVAAEMSVSTGEKFFMYLITIAVYGGVTIFIAYITLKSIKLRRFFEKEALPLIMNDRFIIGNFRKARLDLSEFISHARTNGYFDISQISIATIEPNGRISFLPKENNRPLTGEDLNLDLKKVYPPVNIIMDGKIIRENLKKINQDEEWLNNYLYNNGQRKSENVFLAIYKTDTKSLIIYDK